jgi:hypothetical protein
MFTKGQTVFLGTQEGRVLRIFGPHAGQVATVKEKLILVGFPAKPVGTEKVNVKESWPVCKVTFQN